MGKRLLVLFACAFAAAPLACRHSALTLSQGEWRLSGSLDADRVSRIQILHVPPWLKTPARVDGGAVLQAGADCVVDIRGPWIDRGKLHDVLYNTADRKSTRLNSSHRCISYA